MFVLQHALGELMTNAIEHAFDGYGSGSVEVRGRLTPAGQVSMSVRDHGAWQAPAREANRGRGLALASQLVEELTVEPSAQGTVARLRHTLVRPARMLDAPAAAPQVATPPEVFRVVGQPGDGGARVRIEGAVDVVTAGQALRELLWHSRGGTVPMTVDLSAVTHLSSAGVSALHRVAGQHASAPLRLYATPGSPAQVVLDLVALPYVTLGAGPLPAA